MAQTSTWMFFFRQSWYFCYAVEVLYISPRNRYQDKMRCAWWGKHLWRKTGEGAREVRRAFRPWCWSNQGQREERKEGQVKKVLDSNVIQQKFTQVKPKSPRVGVPSLSRINLHWYLHHDQSLVGSRPRKAWPWNKCGCGSRGQQMIPQQIWMAMEHFPFHYMLYRYFPSHHITVL